MFIILKTVKAIIPTVSVASRMCSIFSIVPIREMVFMSWGKNELPDTNPLLFVIELFFIFIILLTACQKNSVCDSGNTFTLQWRCRWEESARADKEHAVQLSGFKPFHNIRIHHGCTAATPWAACVHILIFKVVNEQSAVIVDRRNVDAEVLFQQVNEQFGADLTQITCENKVIIRRPCVSVVQKALNGLCRRRGCCQGWTIK